MKYKTATLSEAGGREENQDYCGLTGKGEFNCWVLADGLGGHRGGAVAARLAVETFLEVFSQNPEMSPRSMTAYIEAAQDAIFRRQEENPRLYSMRTTLVALISTPEGALWAHLGDSRLYHFRGGGIIFQTRDHSVPQAMADAGKITVDEIRRHEDRNRLLCALGNEKNLRPAVEKKSHPVNPDDAFLLCTDGFWEYVVETEMIADLVRSPDPETWLDMMTTRIKERTEDRHDNYSAIAIIAGEPTLT
ncbi:MAG: serine/threonine-protein phosphatase [Deltaproteobacteria bacterium]|nr:serine/threonine-protein phosphatase [Deltaproteobacteria bacterium]